MGNAWGDGGIEEWRRGAGRVFVSHALGLQLGLWIGACSRVYVCVGLFVLITVKNDETTSNLLSTLWSWCVPFQHTLSSLKMRARTFVVNVTIRGLLCSSTDVGLRLGGNIPPLIDSSRTVSDRRAQTWRSLRMALKIDRLFRQQVLSGKP